MQFAESVDTQSSPLTQILLFGALALLAIVALQGIRIVKGGLFSVNFVKAYGLILVATLGVALVFAQTDAETKTGAFTLLGTIAGYLAGSGKSASESGGVTPSAKSRTKNLTEPDAPSTPPVADTEDQL